MSSGVTRSDTDIAVGLLVRHKKAILSVAAAAIVICAGLAYGAYRWFSPSSNSIDSIAVLPFANGSSGGNTEYLSDGMTESLILNLG